MIKPFSVRYGHVDVREHVQLNDLNSDTRMALWNCLYLFLWTNNRQTATATKCAQSVWIYYLNQPADNIPRYESGYKSDKTLLWSGGLAGLKRQGQIMGSKLLEQHHCPLDASAQN